jgi:hypothetical protein
MPVIPDTEELAMAMEAESSSSEGDSAGVSEESTAE